MGLSLTIKVKSQFTLGLRLGQCCTKAIVTEMAASQYVS